MKRNQKNLYCLLLVIPFLTASLSCKKDKKEEETASYVCTSCVTIPEAKLENNIISKGVYKGVIVGSSGILKIDLMNSNTTATASITLDGKTAILTSTATYVAGQPLSATFSGTLNGQNVSIAFSVGAGGDNPSITTFTLPGHTNARFQLYKETSDNLIQCFEGITEGVKDSGVKQSGQLNMVASMKTNTWSAISTNSGSQTVSIVTGTISGNTFTCNCGPSTTVVGTLAGSQINGTYKGSDNNGTWIAKRTL